MANIVALMASLAASLSLASGVSKEKQTPKRPLTTAPSSMVIYDYDFNGYSGTSAAALWNEMGHFFWFQDNMAAPSIVEKGGRKGLEFTINAKDDSGWTTFGGFGAEGYFSKLISGQRYRVSFYVSFESEASDPIFYHDYRIADAWQGSGIEVHKDGAKWLNWEKTFNTSYNKNLVTYEFVPNGNTSQSYMKLVAQNFNVGDKVFMDDLKVEAVDTVFGTHFNDEAVGDNDNDGAHLIDNIYGKEWGGLTEIKKDSDGVKYMEFAGNVEGNHNAWLRLCIDGIGDLPLVGHKLRYTFNFVNKASILNFSINYPSAYTTGNEGLVVSSPSETTSFAEGSIFNYVSVSENKVVIELTAHIYDPGCFIMLGVNYDEHMLIDVYSIEVEDLSGNVSTSLAYAKYFLEATAVCDATGATNNITSEIWSDLQNKYESLSSVAKETVKKANPNVSGNDLEKAAARYDFIATKYKDTLANYINRPIVSPSSHGLIKPSNEKGFDVVLFLAFLALSAFGVIVLKKRFQKGKNL